MKKFADNSYRDPAVKPRDDSFWGAFLLFSFLLCFSLSVQAAQKPPTLSYAIAHYQVEPEDKPYLEKIENYLTDLTTVASDFIQVAPTGEVTSGKFYLHRPGQLRMEYDAPTPILLVTSGSSIIYYDKELKQVTTIPLSGTLLGFLARPQIRFDKSVKIVDVTRKPESIRVTIVQADHPKDGLLTLEFSDSPLKLRNIVVTDSAGEITTVSLNNARFGGPLDKELFVFHDPRGKSYHAPKN